VDLHAWPIFESPYASCRDRVLDVNDGRQGFTVDWRGALPEYRYYDIVDGERVMTRREWIEDGALRTE
jgi:hypothetical protein